MGFGLVSRFAFGFASTTLLISELTPAVWQTVFRIKVVGRVRRELSKIIHDIGLGII